jgi:hypothetical protein
MALPGGAFGAAADPMLGRSHQLRLAGLHRNYALELIKCRDRRGTDCSRVFDVVAMACAA